MFTIRSKKLPIRKKLESDIVWPLINRDPIGKLTFCQTVAHTRTPFLIPSLPSFPRFHWSVRAWTMR